MLFPSLASCSWHSWSLVSVKARLLPLQKAQLMMVGNCLDFFHFFISGYLNVLCTELCLGLIGIILMLLNVGFCCRQDDWSRNCLHPSHAGSCNHISLPLMYFLLDQFNVFKFFMYSLLIFLWRNCSDCFIYSSPCNICYAAWALIREDNFGEIWFASLEFIDCFDPSQKFYSLFTLIISLN